VVYFFWRTYLIKYILITSMLSVSGQPDINSSEFVITKSDSECIELTGKLQSIAHSEGRKLYTWCMPAKEVTDYLSDKKSK